MKPHRDSTALAERLKQAASTPLPLPHPEPVLVPVPELETVAAPETEPTITKSVRTKAPKPKAKKEGRDTVGVHLRTPRDLLDRYTLAAAERTKRERRVVSAQEVMLEQLERGPG
jgi:hypothetical protein